MTIMKHVKYNCRVLLPLVALLFFLILNYNVFGYVPPFIRTFNEYPYLWVGGLSVLVGVIESAVWFLFAKSESKADEVSSLKIRRFAIVLALVTLLAYCWFAALLFTGNYELPFAPNLWDHKFASVMLYGWFVLFAIKYIVQLAFAVLLLVRGRRNNLWVRVVGWLCLGVALTYVTVFFMAIGTYLFAPLLLLALSGYFWKENELATSNNRLT